MQEQDTETSVLKPSYEQHYTENKLLQVNLRTLDLFLISQNDERKIIIS